MKTPSRHTLFKLLIIVAALWGGNALLAQSNGNTGNNGKANDKENNPSVPAADKLTLLGQVNNAAEAKPLIEKYYAEQEALFQERRAAIERLQGKTPVEQLQIMQALVATQKERRQKNRELEGKISAMLKQDREAKQKEKTNNGNGNSK